MTNHPDSEVQQALVRLCDALCSWERATGRQSTLIVREEGGFVHRALSGKPVEIDVTDERLLGLVSFDEEDSPKGRESERVTATDDDTYTTEEMDAIVRFFSKSRPLHREVEEAMKRIRNRGTVLKSAVESKLDEADRWTRHDLAIIRRHMAGESNTRSDA